jgi:TolB protein
VNHNLHDHLTELAEEVTPVDLRDRVLAASHRSTVRRRVLTASSAAVAVVAIAAGVAWAGLPQPKPGPVVPAVSESPDHSPTPAPSISSSRPSVSTSKTMKPPPEVNLPPRVYYLDEASGKVRTSAGIVLTAPSSCGLMLSPDHSRVSYVDNTDGHFAGDLIVAGVTGGGRRTVLHDVACSGGRQPMWLADSQRLFITYGRGAASKRGVVDVRTGKVSSTPFKDVEDYVTWSPDGSYVAYAEAGKIVVARPDGTVVHRVTHGDETGSGGFAVTGVTDNGRRVVVGGMNTDPGVARDGITVVDLETGRDVALPPPLGQVAKFDLDILVTPENRLLVRHSTKLYLVGPDGKVLDTRTEPSSLRDSQILG